MCVCVCVCVCLSVIRINNLENREEWVGGIKLFFEGIINSLNSLVILPFFLPSWLQRLIDIEERFFSHLQGKDAKRPC